MADSDVCKSKMLNLKTFVCIEYPGVVMNVDNMLNSLGGIDEINRIHYSKGVARLELRFRDNAYCKPTCGEETHVNGLVMKITIKKKTKEVVRGQLVGCVRSCYLFKAPCDFQYLPMYLNPNGSYTSFYKDLVPTSLVGTDWINKEVPLFIPPPTFSRFDTPSSYCYKREPGGDANVDSNVIKLSKCKVNVNSQMMIYETLKVPMGPIESDDTLKPKDKENLEILKKKFEERPIWTRLSLMKEMKSDMQSTKILLTRVAYYFMNGPWMKSWVKYGYDPRKDPDSRKYQVLDYRIPKQVARALDIGSKRNYLSTSLYKSGKSKSQNTTFTTGLVDSGENETEECSQDVPAFIFRAGEIPKNRTSPMQYCDIEIPEIDAILKEETLNECDPQTGWFKKGIEDKLRTTMHNYVKEAANKRLRDTKELKEVPSNESMAIE